MVLNLESSQYCFSFKVFCLWCPSICINKILANFFLQEMTLKPFFTFHLYSSLNIFISVTLFNKYGFIIIPIATSISTWTGVLIYTFILYYRNSLMLKNYFFKNVIKIILITILMSFLLIFALEFYSDYLDYTYKYKSVYLLLIVGFVAGFYLTSCYLAGILKTKNFKTN